MTNQLFKKISTVCIGLFATAMVYASSDGPDYFKVTDVKKSDILNVRTQPDYRSEQLFEVPYNGQCLKNLGCVGGLTFDEFTTLTDEEQAQIIKLRPRWCEIEYEGSAGWVSARYLTESGALCSKE